MVDNLQVFIMVVNNIQVNKLVTSVSLFLLFSLEKLLLWTIISFPTTFTLLRCFYLAIIALF